MFEKHAFIYIYILYIYIYAYAVYLYMYIVYHDCSPNERTYTLFACSVEACCIKVFTLQWKWHFVSRQSFHVPSSRCSSMVARRRSLQWKRPFQCLRPAADSASNFVFNGVSFEKFSSSFDKCPFPESRNVCVSYVTSMTWCIIWACCFLSFYYKSLFVWRTFRICRSSWTRRSPVREVYSFKNLSQDFH